MNAAWDVAIIGGGLAGCSAGIQLAREGFRTLILESQTYPHDKVCGEFLSPDCDQWLKDLGVSRAVCAARPALIGSVRVTAPDGTEWTAALPGTGFGISRSTLDTLLARQARALGAELCEATTVVDVKGDLTQGFDLVLRSGSRDSTVRARAVIAAHGKRGRMDRVLDRAFLRRRQPFVGIKAHFQGPSIPGRVDLHAFPGGYCGLSEIEGHRVNVCLLAREQVFQSNAGGPPADVEAFIAWMRQQNPYLEDWLSRATMLGDRWQMIAQVPFDSKPAFERDIPMAGDAAGLIAPLAGSGMAMALAAGSLAGNMVGRFLAGSMGASSLRREYANAWHRQFDSRMRMGRALQVFLLRPGLLQPGLRFLNTIPALGSFFIARTRQQVTVSR